MRARLLGKGRAAALELSALLLFVASCGPRPEQVAREAFEAFEAADLGAIERALDPSYADGIGGRERLRDDLSHLIRQYPRRTVRLERVEVDRGPTSRARATATVLATIELAGEVPAVRLSGALRLDLIRNGRFRIRSGFLTELRDVLDLLARRRAALEGNDPEAIGRLLHPAYRDGSFDRARLVRVLAQDVEGQVIRLEPIAYRIEVRPEVVHVDEHHRLELNGVIFPPSVARLTLAQSAGRLRIRAGLRSSAERGGGRGPSP